MLHFTYFSFNIVIILHISSQVQTMQIIYVYVTMQVEK